MSGSEFAVMSVYGGLSGPSDPNFANVSLLLHMDGVNGGIVFTDSSSYARSVAANNNATISITQSMFGGSSGFFNGTAYLIYSHATELNLTTGDWTIEGFVNATTLGTNSVMIVKATGTGVYPWQLYYDATGNLVFSAYSTAQALLFTITAATRITTGVWNHWAMTRSGSTFTLWLNGVSQGTATSASALYSAASDPVVIGSLSGAASMTGYLDDVRITKGVARYTAGFSVPTAAFPDH